MKFSIHYTRQCMANEQNEMCTSKDSDHLNVNQFGPLFTLWIMVLLFEQCFPL